MPWVTIRNYRLRQDDVKNYLQNLFPAVPINIQVSQGRRMRTTPHHQAEFVSALPV